MNIGDLKETLHEGIENIQDEALLELIKELITEEYKSNAKIHLTPEQEKELSDSRDQWKKGLLFSATDSDDIIDQWLRK